MEFSVIKKIRGKEVVTGTISYDSKSFIINGKRVIIIAGAIHYFRIPHQLWRDRILKAKRAGFNTIETYVAWNFHELKEGVYDFKGDRDIDKFLSICEELGMYIIVRPGPYICSEWDGGGLPAWLNTKEGTELRTNNPAYLKYVDGWFDRLIPIIVKHQITKGGKVILIQIENEYFYPLLGFAKGKPYIRPGGKEYLEHLRDGLTNRGIKVPLITCNNFAYPISGVIETLTGVGPYEGMLREFKKRQPEAPFLVIELWTGGHDYWGKREDERWYSAVSRFASGLIAYGANYNFYMFCGGTNFGFWAGCGGKGFHATNYDVHAPLTEVGALSEKYYATKLVNQFGQTFSDFIIQAEVVGNKIKPGTSGLKAIVRQKNKEKVFFFINDTSKRIKTFLTIFGKKYHFSVPEQDVKPIFLNYQLSLEMKIVFTNGSLLYKEKIGNRTYLFLYGKEREWGVFVLKLNRKPEIIRDKKTPLSFTWDEKKKILSLSFTHPSKDKRLDVLIKSDINLHLIITNEKLAKKSWLIIKEKETQLLVLGPDFAEDLLHKNSLSIFTRSSNPVVIYSNKNPEGKEFIPQLKREMPALPLLSFWKICIDIPEIYSGINFSSWQKIPFPMAMERVGCNLGYGWYRIEFEVNEQKEANIFFSAAADRLRVFLNGEFVGVWGQLATMDPLPGRFKKGKNILTILVDNLGRHYGGIRLNNPEGLFGPVYAEAKEIDLNGNWEFKLAKEQPAEKWLSVDNRWSIFGEVPDPRAKFTWASINLNLEQGEGASLYYKDIHLPHWIYVNDVLIWYATKDDQRSGDGNFEIGKYLKSGKNEIKFCFENLEDKSILRKNKLVTYPLNSEVSGDWFFRKGICKDELPSAKAWKNWEGKAPNRGAFPVWWRTNFSLDKTWRPIKARMDGMGKGQIYLNGHNIGRYWEIGPQEEYYLPEPWLKDKNELIIFDEEGRIPQKVKLVYDKDWEGIYLGKVKLKE